MLCTGVAFVMFYRLIQRIGAARAATVTYTARLRGPLHRPPVRLRARLA